MRLENRRGDDHATAKFEQKEAQALWLKFHTLPRPTLREVAQELEVAPSTLYRIVTRRSYQK